MNNFTFYSPTYFAFGKDMENDTGVYVRRFRGSKVLIHYGGGSVVRSGLLERVKASLEKEEIPYVILGGVQPNPRSGLVYEGIELCKKEEVDFVLAVGGGSTIDSAKAIATGAVYEGDFWDFFCGKCIEKALPVGTILTIAAAIAQTAKAIGTGTAPAEALAGLKDDRFSVSKDCGSKLFVAYAPYTK